MTRRFAVFMLALTGGCNGAIGVGAEGVDAASVEDLSAAPGPGDLGMAAPADLASMNTADLASLNMPDLGMVAPPDLAMAPDPCMGRNVACPGRPGNVSEGGGLVAVDRCAFALDEGAEWTSLAPLVNALGQKLGRKTVADVLADLNHTTTNVAAGSVPGGPAGVQKAFAWDQAENVKTTWIPQGLTGSADADPTGLIAGRNVVLVSFYYVPPTNTDPEKGVRLALVDVTASPPEYRMMLLVTPSGTVNAPDFDPVLIHAGGLVWYGDYLYVADTSRGFRVFDLSKIMPVATDVDQIGCGNGVCRGGLYKYVVPQVGFYRRAGACAPIFSFVALDRTISPPALVSGEYCSQTACTGPLDGRILRWSLDPKTHRPSAPRIWAQGAWYMGQTQVQGGVSAGDNFYLSSSAPANGAGALYRARVGKSAKSTWIDAPEDVMLDVARGWIWSQSESPPGSRVVFAARIGAYPAP